MAPRGSTTRNPDTRTQPAVAAEESWFRRPQGPAGWFVVFFSAAAILAHVAAVYVYPLDTLLYRSAHLGFASVLTFLLVPGLRWRRSEEPSRWDLLFCLLSLTVVGYTWLTWDQLIYRVGISPDRWDLVIGVLAIVLVLEMTRRVIGWALPILAILALLYGLFGSDLPGVFGFPPISWGRMISLIFSEQGIYGLPLHASASLAIFFLTFGAFLARSGMGDFLLQLSFALTGGRRGGPAKVAVVGSALLGTINGSAVSNVLTTGTFTIPLMKRVGYPPHFAGAVEAVASAGGQLTPPVMGSAAFVLAMNAGLPYSAVMTAALVPSALYYLSLFLMIHYEALRLGLRGLSREELPSLRRVLAARGYLLLPIGLLVFMLLVIRTTPITAALVSTASIIVVSWLSRDTRITIPRALEALTDAARMVLPVASACAAAGIVVGILTISGLGLRLTSIVLSLTAGNPILTLVLTMLICVVLGMGMPTVPAYVVASAVAVPILVQLDIPLLAAHLFVLYFACLSTITPPVANSSYAAASIAESNPMKIGFTAVSLGMSGFIVPFFFASNPALLLQGDWPAVVRSTATATLGVCALSLAMRYPGLVGLQRAGLALGAFLLIDGGVVTDAAGLAALLAVLVSRRFVGPASRSTPADREVVPQAERAVSASVVVDESDASRVR